MVMPLQPAFSAILWVGFVYDVHVDRSVECWLIFIAVLRSSWDISSVGVWFASSLFFLRRAAVSTVVVCPVPTYESFSRMTNGGISGSLEMCIFNFITFCKNYSLRFIDSIVNKRESFSVW